MNLYMFTAGPDEENLDSYFSVILSGSLEKAVEVFCRTAKWYEIKQSEYSKDEHKIEFMYVTRVNTWYVKEIINPELDTEYS